ncbi:hypothetical protein WA026_020387 [Henosepilachna vigintioctopunctata]|uniref:Uncharacterized protein n=1 Tax=Henosepilachna vigintioctopunctata TaxID=420089 RepID=A0AAW1UN94_9CUCU
MDRPIVADENGPVSKNVLGRAAQNQDVRRETVAHQYHTHHRKPDICGRLLKNETYNTVLKFMS